MSTLIEQMRMDMALRNFSPRTITIYSYQIQLFQKYHRQNVENLGEDEIRRFLYHLKTEKHSSNSTLTQAFSAIKFLYREVLKMPLTLSKLRGPKRIFSLPVVFSPEEIQRLFAAVDDQKYRLMLMTTYSAGLRVSETVQLKVSDIDSKRMLIRVEQGKGKKDRYTLLSKELLVQLRDYWLKYRPHVWLFPNNNRSTPMHATTIQKVFQIAKKSAGIEKPATFHTLRHSSATHLLEQGVGLFTIQHLLGHAHIRTTMVYLHTQSDRKSVIINPLDAMLGGK